jgi:mevalonate kinase
LWPFYTLLPDIQDMPAIAASAPGKIILFGEHAVVYGRPAIAVPVEQVQARAVILAEPLAPSGQVTIDAPDIHLHAALEDLPSRHPLRMTVQNTLAALNITTPPAFTVMVSSTIPLASGLGSGAAVSVAIIRSISAFLGKPLPDEKVSALAYQTEQLYHGTPSGIDNTVITYARPVYFQRGQPIQTFSIARPMTMVIGDSGIQSSTARVVGAVRAHWQADPASVEALLDAIGTVVLQARLAIEQGNLDVLGSLMDNNHRLLQQLGVSCPKLDRLVDAARSAGASGAKLSGAGGGGNMIALTTRDVAAAVATALKNAGAVRTITTHLKNQG